MKQAVVNRVESFIEISKDCKDIFYCILAFLLVVKPMMLLHNEVAKAISKAVSYVPLKTFGGGEM